MTLTVPDELARLAGLTDRDALVELACRLYDADRLNFFNAAKMAGLQRVEFESALKQRVIPIHRPTVADLEHDFAALSGVEK